MYSITEKPYGFELVFAGFIQYPEMVQWHRDSIEKLKSMSGRRFSVVVDMSAMKTLPPDAKAELEKGQKLYKAMGMERSAVIVDSAGVAMQLKRLATESGISTWERYIPLEGVEHPMAKATAWASKGIEP